jgi:hypothetical protein
VNTAAATIEPKTRPSLWERLFNEFPASAEEWSRSVNRLNRWEEEHLLGNPSPKDLAEHRKYVERLMFFGQLCAFVAAHPELGDVKTAQMVAATQEVLRNKLLMFHDPMPTEEADAILKEVFPEPGAGAAR